MTADQPVNSAANLDDYNRVDDAINFLEFLFEPDDIFEVRTKGLQDRVASSYWVPFAKRRSFVEKNIPIHEKGGKHIWVGVLPRPKVGSKHPEKGNTLWVDLDETITTPELALEALRESGLPAPSMVVYSGGGFHFYWKLNNFLSSEDLRAYSKGVHQALPSDNTHDPTRIMRVPGTFNPKRESYAYTMQATPYSYDVDLFPKADMTIVETSKVVEAPFRELNPEDRDALVNVWIPGSLHYLTLGTAGYLRKDLGYSKDQAVAEIKSIFESAGLTFDDHAMGRITDTYNNDLNIIAGHSILQEHGVSLKGKALNLKFTPKAPKPNVKGNPMMIIDPDEVGEQHFWVPGLVGPGLMTLWVAPQKTGKSFAAMQLAYALSTGTDLWDFEITEKKRVLYFQGELAQHMVTQRWDAMFGKESRSDIRKIAMTDKPQTVVDLLENPEILMDLAGNYDVIIVDPISVFTSIDENKGREVNDFLSLFRPLQNAGKAVILVHHMRKLPTDKNGKPRTPSFSDVRGSGAYTAYVDATALHYLVGNFNNTQVQFQFRAAPDRENLDLYRLKNGSFTHDKEKYLADHRTEDGRFRLKIGNNESL